MTNSTVLILLAAYNGETYIRAQVDSLLAQDHPHIKIVLSDDGSTDRTPAILEQYAKNHSDRIIHYHSNTRFGCAQKHFMHLLTQFHDEPYIMFCDQDDIWHTDKVSKTLVCMHQIEDDPQIPALIHTDLRVVDKNLALINPSFCNHSNLDGHRLGLNQLLVQNVVTGCTMMINRALAVLACEKPVSDAMRMHDWWLAILASVSGKCAFLNEATIDYRQHGSNSVGAKNVRSMSYLWTRLRSKSMRPELQKAADQAAAFLENYTDILSADQHKLIRSFADTRHQNLLRRNIVYIQNGLLKSGILRKVVQLLGI